ncbi:MAG TPA: SRPBCC family protein [Chryseosolibacter sp.]|nr:SRPBCC family protein [Chryseosolibacter sp.]
MEADTMTMNQEDAKSMLPPATGSTNINVGPGERILSTFVGAAATVYGLRHLGSLGGLVTTLAGSLLLSRGVTGYCAINNAFGRNSNTVTRKTSAMEIKGTFTVNKPRAEVYAFWRKLENLPLFMKHLEDVKEEDSVNSTWKARIPGGVGTVTWKALITEDRPQELLSWATQPGSTIDNAGEVTFKDAPGDRGTEISIHMTYRLPAGDVGTIAGKLFNPVVEKMMKDDLRRFKSLLETGELQNAQGATVSSRGGSGLTESETEFADTDAELVKPRKTRSRKTPDPSFQNTSTPDAGTKGTLGSDFDEESSTSSSERNQYI